VQITEIAMAAAITVSLGGASYAALNTEALTGTARTVAEQADCRAVDTAIVGYLAENGVMPHQIADVEPYVSGDISAYRIVDGLAAGPGCDPVTTR
jgi:hypothetical protein